MGNTSTLLQFNKLRLTGFKSFVDNTELHISLGLTGVVGPNGCGKSNLVEALRWVMGETSAKQMRGSGMDDVIFGGTATRPQRNSAEVVLALDNNDRTAPAQFNDEKDLEVSRKIERERGSTYRVNGKEVRARDVQLLFADSSTGARSTAMVSQGRIGAVINAKPQQRRGLLEEAAGITGLHSRRHEAELRLRGAETNLERLDDIMVTLETQLVNLKKQTRQANRYTNLSDHIRKAEATLFYLRWKDAEAALAKAEETMRSTQGRVGELTGLAGKATTDQAARAEALPPLRLAEANAAAELHRITVARDNLAIEEQRIQDATDQSRQRLEQIAKDRERAIAFAADATSTSKKLSAEQGEIEITRSAETEEHTAAAEALAAANTQVEETETALNTATALVADIDAQRNGLTHRIGDLEQRLDRMTSRAEEIERQRAELDTHQQDNTTVDEAERTVASCAVAVEAALDQQREAEETRTATEQALSRANAAFQDAHTELARLKAEETAIAKILDAVEDDLWPPLIDAITVKPGFEAALGAALGEDLNVPADEAAPVHWRTLAPLSSALTLPKGTIPMSELVEAPPSLARRLRQIGVVDTDDQGILMARSLAQGQRIVSREGGLWRWDGYTVLSEATTPAAVRLEQRNRLAELRGMLDAATEAVGEVGTVRDAAREAERAARNAEQNTSRAVREALQTLNVARETLASKKEQATIHESRLIALNEALETAVADRDESAQNLSTQQTELAHLPEPLAEREKIIRMRTELAKHRNYQVDCYSRHDQLERLAQERANRLQSIASELQTWQRRNVESARQLEDLMEREQALKEELTELAAKPAELDSRRQELMSAVETSEAKRKKAADSLAEAEIALRDGDQILREAETALAQAREYRVRAEGSVDQAKQVCTGIAERVADRLSCRPVDLFEISGLDAEKALPELEATERKVDRLIRERETMGPVNLRARQEAEELTEQINTLNSERDDLLEAIKKLRRGISELNREGRARLLASFKEVDRHFQKLFVRLFGGGGAHLALTESDDPLEAGLEIMASPPGKKLQVLSLLSGGEQALTALALLFGVFLTNPAPICVLDEVDAPLDDANVDRFCTLLEEMTREEKTRFLIITHHRMTMARMDRLFGVTMAERGVSQLVSVDLQEAELLRDIA